MCQKEKMLVTSIFSFFHNVFYPMKDWSHHMSNHYSVTTANPLNLDKSKILLFIKGLNKSIQAAQSVCGRQPSGNGSILKQDQFFSQDWYYTLPHNSSSIHSCQLLLLWLFSCRKSAIGCSEIFVVCIGRTNSMEAELSAMFAETKIMLKMMTIIKLTKSKNNELKTSGKKPLVWD